MCHVCAPVDRPLPPPVTGGLGDVTPKPAPGSGVVDRPNEGGEPQPQPHDIPAGMPRVAVRHGLFQSIQWEQSTPQRKAMIVVAVMAAAAVAVFRLRFNMAVLPVTTTPSRSGGGST